MIIARYIFISPQFFCFMYKYQSQDLAEIIYFSIFIIFIVESIIHANNQEQRIF